VAEDCREAAMTEKAVAEFDVFDQVGGYAGKD
jgi:hypothetical protein